MLKHKIQVLVLTMPALKAIRALQRQQRSFDLAWADPPFDEWQAGIEALGLAAAVRAGAQGDSLKRPTFTPL